jgi:uncharacterized membrane protein SpoIIM required for sporulation
MNLERWVRSRKPAWQHLESLLQQIERRGLRSLGRKELHELGRFYRAASADLSRARALNVGGEIAGYLNGLVVRAHNQVYQRPTNRWSDLWRFLWETFPALVRRHILHIAAAFALFVAPAGVCFAMVYHDIDFAHMELIRGQSLVSEELWHTIENRRMWTDAAQGASPLMSSEIATNNIRVALLAFALGVTGGIGTAVILLMNGMQIGTVFGVCRIYGMDYRLAAFVASHGVLELSAIFICGGAGLLLGQALLFPGNWSRRDALKLAAKPAMGLFAGCLPILLIAGLIEGFVSPRTDISATAKFAV